jgi:hypothetical protein
VTEERENYLTGLIAILMSAAFFPTTAVIGEPAQIGELHYIDDETYPVTTHEEIEQEEDPKSY